MLTNHTHSKRLPRPSFTTHKAPDIQASHVDNQESEYIIAELHLDAEDEEYAEYVQGMKLTRYLAICEMVTIVFMILGLFAIYQRHGYIPGHFLRFIGIMFIIMIPMAISLWRQSRDFFLEHNKKTGQ